jgi:hypothetical protein
MNVILDLFFIQVIFVFITDITDFPSNVKKGISWVLTKGKIVKDDYRLHLLDCSLCQIWWSGIIYLFCTSNFTLPYLAIVCLLCTFTGLLKDCILLIEDIARKVINIIYKYFIDR